MDKILLQAIKDFKATESFDKTKTMVKPVIDNIVKQHIANDAKDNIASDEKTIRKNVTNSIILQVMLVPIVNDLYKNIMHAVIKYMNDNNIAKQLQHNTLTSIDVSMIMTLAHIHKNNDICKDLIETFKKHNRGNFNKHSSLNSYDYIG